MEDMLDEIAAGAEGPHQRARRVLLRLRRVVGLHPLVAGLGDIDARELATFPIGGPKRHRAPGRPLRPLPRGPRRRGQPDRRRANVPDDLPPDELTLEKASELFAKPAGEEIGSGPPLHRSAGRRQERPVRAVRHRGASRGRQEDDKPRTGSLFQAMSLDTITLETPSGCSRCHGSSALDLEGVEITAQNGRYGPYLKKGSDSRSLTSEDSFQHHLGRGAGDLRPAEAAWPRGRGPAPQELGDDRCTRQPVLAQGGPVRRVRHRRREQRDPPQGRHRRDDHPRAGR